MHGVRSQVARPARSGFALSDDQLRTAVRLRAQHGALCTPDALQLAATISTGCESVVTDDRRMPAPDGLRVLQLSKFA